MKKILLSLLSASLILLSCKKDNDRVFKESFDERINGSLAKYQSVLSGAQYGWKAFITTDNGNGGTYAFYMKFNDSNRVTMVSDFDTAFAVTPKASSYRLRQQQQPTLIFDTYSYVHILADPNENVVIFSDVNHGEVGQGLLSDFEFIIKPDDIASDTLKLTGKVNGARLVMTKATAEESAIFLGGRWVLLESYLTKKLLTYYKRTTINGTDYDIYNDPINKSITFQYMQGTTVLQHTTGYYNTISGIILYDPLPTSAGPVSAIDVDSWDASTNTLNIKIGSQSSTIKETVFPLEGALDKDAPNRWLSYADDNENYWISITGFHVNGEDDAFKIMTLPQYYFLAYFPPSYFGTQYPVFTPIILTDAGLDFTYYSFISFTTDANGIARFRLRGGSNNPPFPTGTNPARLTRNQMLLATGYYFVQVNETQYDMVSAADGKAWISWYF
ncbi:MAG: DUF4302 domain-containing protein [Ferruginibacter sp.]